MPMPVQDLVGTSDLSSVLRSGKTLAELPILDSAHFLMSRVKRLNEMLGLRAIPAMSRVFITIEEENCFRQAIANPSEDFIGFIPVFSSVEEAQDIVARSRN